MVVKQFNESRDKTLGYPKRISKEAEFPQYLKSKIKCWTRLN